MRGIISLRGQQLHLGGTEGLPARAGGRAQDHDVVPGPSEPCATRCDVPHSPTFSGCIIEGPDAGRAAAAGRRSPAARPGRGPERKQADAHSRNVRRAPEFASCNASDGSGAEATNDYIARPLDGLPLNARRRVCRIVAPSKPVVALVQRVK